jgi:BlaI family transcriptional regulator, penicillinase repressor
MSRPPLRLGKVQLRIMHILWQSGEATARAITDSLSRDAPVAHSTVQTLLRKLEAKGAVTHDIRERTFYFRPLYARDEVTDTALRDVLARLFHGSVYGLVSQLLAYEKLPPEELRRLRRLIDTTEKGDNEDADVDQAHE